MTKRPEPLRLTVGMNADGAKETEDEVAGRALIEPAVSAGLAMNAYGSHMPGQSDLNASIAEVKRITEAVQSGDLKDIEGMLVAQAVALQTISANCLNRAQLQTGQRNLEAFFSMGLKAQSQSRATLQALVDLKFPRQVAFVKQANISAGNQQVNNGVSSPAGNLPSQQNKILEATDGEWLDGGAPRAAIGTDPRLDAVEAGHGTKDGRGQGKGRAQQLQGRAVEGGS